MSQDKLQTMVMQKSWGVIEVYYGILQVVNLYENHSSVTGWQSVLSHTNPYNCNKTSFNDILTKIGMVAYFEVLFLFLEK